MLITLILFSSSIILTFRCRFIRYDKSSLDYDIIKLIVHQHNFKTKYPGECVVPGHRMEAE